mmetsp:Transcript_125874/g.326869  ORF Transcript_125874/g.326869 Transcript_125874/m.326869 type:complete len:227 (-) Transcript_125874:471-1151(-)
MMYSEIGASLGSVPKLSVPWEMGCASAGMKGTMADLSCDGMLELPARKVLYRNAVAKLCLYSREWNSFFEAHTDMSWRKAASTALKEALSNGRPQRAVAALAASSKVSVTPPTEKRARLTTPPCLSSNSMQAPKLTVAAAKTWRGLTLNVSNTVLAVSLGIVMESTRTLPLRPKSWTVLQVCLFESTPSTSNVAPAAAKMVAMSDGKLGCSRVNIRLPAHEATLRT